MTTGYFLLIKESALQQLYIFQFYMSCKLNRYIKHNTKLSPTPVYTELLFQKSVTLLQAIYALYSVYLNSSLH